MNCGDWIEIIVIGIMLLILRYKELIGNEYKIQIVTSDGTVYPID